MIEWKSKITKRPFEVTGFTIEEYLRWCEKNSFKPYLSSTKKEFFKRINQLRIFKRNNKIFEDGKEF